MALIAGNARGLANYLGTSTIFSPTACVSYVRGVGWSWNEGPYYHASLCDKGDVPALREASENVGGVAET